MPSAIELDLKHWVRVVPVEGRTQVVTCRSFACFYSGLGVAAPPELSTEGTELATGSTLTIEGSGRWFIAKKAASTEEQKPSLLEVAPASLVGEGAWTAQVSRTSGEEYEASSTRLALVLVEFHTVSANGGAFKIEIGGTVLTEGVTAGSAKAAAGGATCTFFLPPGVKWKPTATGEATTIKSSYYLL